MTLVEHEWMKEWDDRLEKEFNPSIDEIRDFYSDAQKYILHTRLYPDNQRGVYQIFVNSVIITSTIHMKLGSEFKDELSRRIHRAKIELKKTISRQLHSGVSVCSYFPHNLVIIREDWRLSNDVRYIENTN